MIQRQEVTATEQKRIEMKAKVDMRLAMRVSERVDDPSATRVDCEVIGRPKLLAEINPLGITCWCKICRTAHMIPRAVVMAAWERGESVQYCNGQLGEMR